MVSPGSEFFGGELKPLRGTLSSSHYLVLPADREFIAIGYFSCFRRDMLEDFKEILKLFLTQFLCLSNSRVRYRMKCLS